MYRFLTRRVESRNVVLVCQVCPRLLVLPLEIHLTRLCVSQCHVDFGMSEEFFHGR